MLSLTSPFIAHFTYNLFAYFAYLVFILSYEIYDTFFFAFLNLELHIQ